MKVVIFVRFLLIMASSLAAVGAAMSLWNIYHHPIVGGWRDWAPTGMAVIWTWFLCYMVLHSCFTSPVPED